MGYTIISLLCTALAFCGRLVVIQTSFVTTIWICAFAFLGILFAGMSFTVKSGNKLLALVVALLNALLMAPFVELAAQESNLFTSHLFSEKPFRVFISGGKLCIS